MTIPNPRLHHLMSDIMKWQATLVCPTYTMLTQIWQTTHVKAGAQDWIVQEHSLKKYFVLMATIWYSKEYYVDIDVLRWYLFLFDLIYTTCYFDCSSLGDAHGENSDIDYLPNRLMEDLGTFFVGVNFVTWEVLERQATIYFNVVSDFKIARKVRKGW